MSRCLRVVPLVVLSALLVLWGSHAHATNEGTAPRPRGLVIVLRPDDVDVVTRTALARVTGELTAARFQVDFTALDPKDDPTHQVETVSPQTNPVAVLAIAHVKDASADTVAIWVCDRVGKRTTIQRMELGGGDVSRNAATLALEAIELIRASLTGLWPIPPADAAPNTPPPNRATASQEPPNRDDRGASSSEAPGSEAPGKESPGKEPPSKEPPSTETAPIPFPFHIGIGAAALEDVGVSEPEWLGSLAGGWALSDQFSVRAQIVGLGPALQITEAAGSASVHRSIGVLGVVWTFIPNAVVQPFVTAFAGAVHIRAVGASPTPRLAHIRTAWSALTAVGLGIRAPLGPRWSVAAEIDGLVTMPPVVLRIAETDSKPISRPGVLAHVALEVCF